MPDIDQDQYQDQNQGQDEPYQLTGDQLSEMHGLAQQLDAANDPRAQRIWDFIQGQTGGGDGNQRPQFTMTQSPPKVTSWLEDLENDLWGSKEESANGDAAQASESGDEVADGGSEAAAGESSVAEPAEVESARPQQEQQLGVSDQDTSGDLLALYTGEQPQPAAKSQSPTGARPSQPASQKSIKDTAQAQLNSTDYLLDKARGSFKGGVDKCNLGVADWIEQSGRPRPQVKYPDPRGWLGLTRDPSSHEWADPAVQIPGWSSPMPLSQARPGDVIAQEHGDKYGHVGIVIAPNQTISVNSKTHPAGIVTNTDWGFRPRLPYGPDGLGQNGEKPTDPDVVVRRYMGDQKKTPFGGGGGEAW